MAERGGRRILQTVLIGLVALVLAGCTSVPWPPKMAGRWPQLEGVAPGPPRPAPAPTSTKPTGTELPTSPDRPRSPVPDVRAQGIVAPPPGAGVERYRQQEVSWGSCPDESDTQQCARVLAPLDWSDPDRDALRLFLRRVPATKQPRLGAIFVNPGGPGESGADLATDFARQGLEQFDIVGWDPRGTGRSTPVKCASDRELDAFFEVDVSPDDEAERDAVIAASEQFGQACLAHSGRLLEHISTTDTVADLELLRGLVGEEKLNYFGYSYGTAIGSRYADTYPARVGRVALDGAVSLAGAEDEEITQATGFDRALENFADWCVEKKCSLGKDRGQVIGSITELFDRLDSKPIAVGDRRLTQSQAVTGVIVTLYGAQDEWQLLLEGVEEARNGDGFMLLWLADFYNARDEEGGYDTRTLAFAAIRCLDSGDYGIAGTERRAEAENKQAPILGPYFGADYICPTWPVPPVAEPRPVVATGAAPILIIGSTGDSATPYEFAEQMADQLDSGVLLTYDGPGHGAYGGKSTCIDEAVVRYFTSDTAPVKQTCH